ncbi:hypothetical protein COC58_20990 [Bacillus cereus]|uniref:AimR family lysis-lysogeny pheromone receptor n=1 Tax=Bacillus cereus TaxID=1396 RepID=UPI000BFE7497|nr:AimR family lysis-lysogeny pheromone receptor [Bacillus cereus]PGS38520.1 hypothetical protein COC58_20990 [Bacillus cereus]PGU42304.1 hypothetical protein COD91_18220 [Bacillus cereus]
MKKLMDEVLETINSNNLSIRKLATEIDISRTTLWNGLHTNHEMKLEAFIKLMKKMYTNSKEIRMKIKTFIMKCKSDLNIRKALCYCQASGEYDVLHYLVRKHKENDDLKKYIVIYELFNKRNQNEARGRKLENMIYDLNVSKDAERKTLIEMLLTICMYDSANYSAMIPHANKIKGFLPKIKNSLVHDYLQMHYYERLAYVELLNGNVEQSRAVCNKILQSDLDLQFIKATAMCCLGESYIFTDVLKAEEYILKAIDCLKDVPHFQQTRKYKAFKTTLAFIYIEFGFNLDKIDFSCIEQADVAFYEAKYGDREVAKRILKSIENDNDKLSPFQLYYLSYAYPERNKEYLNKSLEEFAKNGNIFYIKVVQATMMEEMVS